MLAILTALREELTDYLAAGAFKRTATAQSIRYYQSEAQPDVVVVEGGMGRERAETATEEVIERFEPDIIISAGFAGAVKAELQPGDLLVCDMLMSLDGPAALWGPDISQTQRSVDGALMERLLGEPDGPRSEYAHGGCLSVSTFVPSSPLKGWIGEHFPVRVIDMESYWVGETAARCGVAHMAVRSVLDTMEQDLPPFIGQEAATADHHRWYRALRYMVANPFDTRRLLQMRRQARIASASLGRLLEQIVSRRP